MLCMNKCDYPDTDGGLCRCELDARRLKPEDKPTHKETDMKEIKAA